MVRRSEFELINEVFATLSDQSPAALGLKDDAAVFAVGLGREVVATTDVLVGGKHFRLDDPPCLVGQKALRVSLSDLASMGAEPKHYLLSVAIAGDMGDQWMEQFVFGLAKDQNEFGIKLIGGDTVATFGPPVFSLTALGDVPSSAGLLRSGAEEGDDIWVSGTIGDAALGLRLDEEWSSALEPSEVTFLRDQYLLPQPRLGLGIALRGLANSCIDVSDGLVADLEHICDESKLGGQISFDQIPLSFAARQVVGATKNAKLDQVILNGGDDYELLFTAAPENKARIEIAASASGVQVTQIGIMTRKLGVSICRSDKTKINLSRKGYRHF